ncbi:MAG TPA: TIGR03000 domain-containing protein [Gemmataceae bacterium]|jgi:uncharacterized protein (TIGR03000 family)|nr:TIGR03000 domain-containing protein [Gemmataceae bacterium]
MRLLRSIILSIVTVLLFAFASASAQESQEANIRVYLPTADARLEVQGVMTKQEGVSRLFKSPGLTPGKSYVYDMKATWMENGKQLVREKSIRVMAGMTTEVDFRMGEALVVNVPPVLINPEARPKPKPETKPEVKPEPKPEVKPEPKPGPNIEIAPAPALKLDVPYVPSPEKVVDKMLEMAKVKEGDIVYDLGCGDGRIVITAVTKFKARRGVGIDLDPARIKESDENAKKAGVADQVEFRQSDILKLTEKDLSGATVVTLYLLPKVNDQLMPLLKKLKPGTRIVSHDFGIDDWKSDEQADVRIPDQASHSVYMWIVK